MIIFISDIYTFIKAGDELKYIRYHDLRVFSLSKDLLLVECAERFCLCFKILLKNQLKSSLTRSYAAFLGAQPTSANLQQTGLYHRYFPARFVKFNTTTFHRTHISRSSHWKCSVKKGILKISKNLREKNCARVSFSIKLLVFYVIEHVWTTAFVQSILLMQQQTSKSF